MNTNHDPNTLDRKTLLSTLWIFVLLNIIFRDIHEFAKAELLQEIMSGTVNGMPITEQLMLIGGIVSEIPIAMVLLSRVLDYRVNRWANIITGLVTLVIVITGSRTDLDDMFHAIIEIIALLYIIWSAWTWKYESIPAVDANQSSRGLSA